MGNKFKIKYILVQNLKKILRVPIIKEKSILTFLNIVTIGLHGNNGKHNFHSSNL